MFELSLIQHDIVMNAFSMTMAAMGGASLFFFSRKSGVLPKYQTCITLLGVVTAIATYNYYRLHESWNASYKLVNGVVKATGVPFDDSYRYADWLLTVPMLMVALVMVLDLSSRQARVRSFVLALLSAEMIILGYPGQISSDAETRWIWWGVSMIPFILILYQLFVSLSGSIADQPPAAKGMVSATRYITVVAWSVYPAVYVLPMFEVVGAEVLVATQVGYAAADIAAKVAYGLLIFSIAVSKSRPVEEALPSSARSPLLKAA